MALAARLIRTRWLVRAPIGMFRAGLGFLFAGRLLLLEHTGRTSGQARYVVLETVSRSSATEVFVASGFGAQAQWLLNVRANAHCFVSVGWVRRAPAVAEVLDDQSAAAVLDDYAREHPRAWRELHSLMAELAGIDDPVIPVVRLTLDTDPGAAAN